MKQTAYWLALALAAAAGCPALAAPAVEQRMLAAHVGFLAGDALHGRGSATADEAVAAAYVAAQFEAVGLVPPPGQAGYLQPAAIEFPALAGQPALTVNGHPIASLALLSAIGEVRGRAVVAAPGVHTSAGAVVVAPAGKLADVRDLLAQRPALLIIAETAETRLAYDKRGSKPRLPPHLQGATPSGSAVATVSAADLAAITGATNMEIVLTVPLAPPTIRTTTNAIGYLPGTDAAAGLLLLTAHLDHLGVVGGVVMPGANDDASGTAAVIELARVLAAGNRSRRGILFVVYGSEEAGEFGSAYFAAHPPVPLDRIAANIEFEMVGAPDPKLPAGALMMTGFERSNVGVAFQQQGAKIVADPYPDQHFFERSDNYQLALQGVVAHTVSGWATNPTYHTPADTVASLDLPFMTRAVASLVAPLRWLANAPFAPAWNPGGRPVR